ncbi:MAG TPA: AraC family transcriptional regulator ligand-binding domain-containing protein [Solimonas sp.]|nr:AraC family transcriptional regulator ligand-binding domain-containing protein [Solimonas sp.]
MASLGIISRYARAMIDSASAHGYTMETIGEAAELPPALLREGAPQFDAASFCRLSRNLKLLMMDEFCGFTAQPCAVGSFVRMCERGVTSNSLGEALAQSFRYYANVTSDIGFDLHVHPDVTAVAMNVARPELDRHRVQVEWWFLIWSRFAGWLIGEEIPLVAAEFPHPCAGPLEEYAEAFDGLSRFSRPSAQLLLPTRYLDRPIVRSHDDLRRFVMPQTIDLGQHFEVQRSLRAQLKLRMLQALRAGQPLPSIEEVAEAWHVSSQTLRRRLEAECSSYRILKEEVRRQEAARLLRQGDLSIGEVSLRAGFAETNGLSRALKTWAGLSPSEYRACTQAAG